MNQKGAIFAQKKLAGGRKKKGKKAKKEEKDLKLLDGERAMLHVILIMLIFGRIRLLLLVLEDVHGGGADCRGGDEGQNSNGVAEMAPK